MPAGTFNINIANLSTKRGVVGLHVHGYVKEVTSCKVYDRITFSESHCRKQNFAEPPCIKLW